jgi:flagellar biogenesis protein FliO
MFDSSVLQSFLPLILLVGFLGGVLFLLKKLSLKAKSKKSEFILNVISKTTIQPKTHLYIVQAASRFLLLGVSDHSVTTLADLTDELKSSDQLAVQKKISAITKKGILSSGNSKNPQVKDENSLSFGSFLRSALRKN